MFLTDSQINIFEDVIADTQTKQLVIIKMDY